MWEEGRGAGLGVELQPMDFFAPAPVFRVTCRAPVLTEEHA